ERRPGVVEGGEVELGDVVAVGDLAAGRVDVRPDLHVVHAAAGEGEEPARLALALDGAAQVDDGGEGEALQQVEVGVGERDRAVGAEHAPWLGQAAARDGKPAQVAGVERALERQEPGGVRHGGGDGHRQ